ncbi:glycosyltransferase family 2 protein [Bradyrhizobium sp. CCGUVB14]|uniref:glycosyltransferase family 2 protein n=1 Tax=Bradyrhizobium sp. CCGUVB14 TaxID=2949628 RepID=UPI0020B2C429|nr:glycosyltransferase family 2 protein [Bradyrhizobium sp. CCGUVB14]MCP3442038.1 glycosyltransferase family 2 protein [Bradyrhizobium sp. CCGUVB14]
MRLLIVIVNYRVAELTIDCLRSLQDEIAGVPGTRVAVCENGSGDGSALRIGQAIEANGWGAWCSLLASETNLGFCGGNNVLIRPALATAEPPDYVLLLNPDTVVRPGAIKALVDFMAQNPNVGIAGSRLEDPDGTPQRSAFRFQSALSEFEGAVRLGLVSRLLSRFVVAPPVVDEPTATDWVAGASMIVRREVFADIGLLDEGYFTYFDDIDFCFNACKKGWPTWYVPASRVVHLVGQSTGVNRIPRRLPAYMLEARRRYFLKNHGALYAALADAGALAGLALFGLRNLASGGKHQAIPHALGDYFRHSVYVRGVHVPNVRPLGL